MSVLEILIFADMVGSQLGIRLPTNLLFQFLFEYRHVQYTDAGLIQSQKNKTKSKQQQKQQQKQPTNPQTINQKKKKTTKNQKQELPK